MGKKCWLVPVITILALLVGTTGCGSAQSGISAITLPPGFQISIYASDVEGARSLTLGEKGVVFVGSRDAGCVYALVDEKKTGSGVTVIKIATGLDTPNGVAFHKGSLYVAEISRVLRYDHIMDNCGKRRSQWL